MKIKLRMTAVQFAELRQAVLPEDGTEAVAFVLCGRRSGDDEHVLLYRKLHRIPAESYFYRTRTSVRWNTEPLISILNEALANEYAVLKVHGHPCNLPSFSDSDDCSDRRLFPSIYGWMDEDYPHGSLILLGDGTLVGRAVLPNGQFSEFDKITVVGNDIVVHHSARKCISAPSEERIHQAFGSATLSVLRNLSAAVIGCSGTGSIVAEQLVRMHIGEIILVDPDVIEERNLNRIINSSRRDIGRYKVNVFGDAVRRAGLPSVVTALPTSLMEPNTIKRVAQADVVFGCMDGVEGRHYLNLLATYYTIPYIDVGVRLDADGSGGVSQIAGTVHYVQPGLSSLLSRNQYTLEQLRSEGLRRTNPDQYSQQLRDKYIVGVQEDRPAVISVNMLASSLAVNELLARLHPFRTQSNGDFAAVRFSLVDSFLFGEPEGDPDFVLQRAVGRGDVVPLLNRPDLSGGRSETN